jgi:hypothetical protein
LVADSHIIVDSWRKCFSQLFNVHGAKDVEQAEIHTAEPLVPEPSASENMVLRRIFVPRRDEVTGEWRRLHYEELNDLYTSPNIVRTIK